MSEADLQALLDISEEDVKHSIADIIGEPFVPKDWAGEKSDLQTNSLTIDDRPHSAAFIFWPMRIGLRGLPIAGPSALSTVIDSLISRLFKPLNLLPN